MTDQPVENERNPWNRWKADKLRQKELDEANEKWGKQVERPEGSIETKQTSREDFAGTRAAERRLKQSDDSWTERADIK